MSQRSIPKPSPLPSAPLASGSSHPPFEKPATIANSYAEDVSKSKSTPRYRTTKGMVIIILAALVAVGIAVGVAVGVTQSKNNRAGAAAVKSGEENQLPTNAATNTGGGTPGIATTGIATTPVAPPGAVSPSPYITGSRHTTGGGTPIQTNG